MHTFFFSEDQKESDNLEDIEVGDRIILESIFGLLASNKVA
jgi:hypothetical protein